VEAVPEFAGHKKVFSLDNSFIEGLLNSQTDFFFVVVDPGFVDVAVPLPESRFNGFVNLTLFAQPGP